MIHKVIVDRNLYTNFHLLKVKKETNYKALRKKNTMHVIFYMLERVSLIQAESKTIIGDKGINSMYGIQELDDCLAKNLCKVMRRPVRIYY